MFLDIIHHPVFIWKHRPVYFSKHDVSETGFCLRLQVKATQLGPIDRHLYQYQDGVCKPVQLNLLRPQKNIIVSKNWKCVIYRITR
jgi:hypothetical protein